MMGFTERREVRSRDKVEGFTDRRDVISRDNVEGLLNDELGIRNNSCEINKRI
jgi:hypothetical protein